MAGFLGNTPAEKYISLEVQHFTTSATSSYVLSNSVTNENEVALYLNNVRQQPGSSYAYTCSGTALSLSSATSGTDTLYCVYLGRSVGTINPPDGSVSDAKITAMASSKLTGSVAVANGGTGITAVGTSGNVLTSTGSAWASTAIPASGITMASTLATTSGANADFTGIPSGTKAIDVVFSAIGINIGGNVVVQIGDSGGIEATGYLNTVIIHSNGTPASQDGTTWFSIVHSNIGGNTWQGYGIVQLRLVDPATYTWTANGQILNTLGGALNNYTANTTYGVKSLSSELTTVRITNTNVGGGAVFDTGKATIQYF
jgi:hypothetical protein